MIESFIVIILVENQDYYNNMWDLTNLFNKFRDMSGIKYLKSKFYIKQRLYSRSLFVNLILKPFLLVRLKKIFGIPIFYLFKG